MITNNKEMNEEIMRQAHAYLGMFPDALKKALGERNRVEVAQLALAFHRFANNTCAYIDQCAPEDLDARILTLADDLRMGEAAVWGALRGLLNALKAGEEDTDEETKNTN